MELPFYFAVAGLVPAKDLFSGLVPAKGNMCLPEYYLPKVSSRNV